MQQLSNVTFDDRRTCTTGEPAESTQFLPARTLHPPQYTQGSLKHMLLMFSAAALTLHPPQCMQGSPKQRLLHR
eukprot:1148208-Pelagomonas_calceolata.AAC.15